MTVKHRVLLISIVPPLNDCGVRIVMNRHFIERRPFELHIASSANFADDLLVHTMLSAVFNLSISKTEFEALKAIAWFRGKITQCLPSPVV